jgi:hypothetical protein
MNKKNILKENNRIKKLMNIKEVEEVGGIRQLIYNPMGYGYTKGKKVSGFKVKNHDNHLHIGFTNKEIAMKIMDKSMSMGLRTSENPYTFGKTHGDPTGKVERVHVKNSAHYENFGGSPTVGKGVDISGNPQRVKELIRWIESEFKGKEYKIDDKDEKDNETTISSDSDYDEETSGLDDDSGDPEDKLKYLNYILAPITGLISQKYGNKDEKDKEEKNKDKKNSSLNESFVFPSKNPSKVSDLDSKKVTFECVKGSRIYAPNGGVISLIDDSSCNGKIVIQTRYEDVTYLISLCGVKSNKSLNEDVNTGENIGIANDTKVVMEIIDKSKSKNLKIAPFYQEKKTEDPEDKRKVKSSDFEIDKIHHYIMQAPFKGLGKMVSGVYKKLGQSKPPVKENLKEEIQKMKKLMK